MPSEISPQAQHSHRMMAAERIRVENLNREADQRRLLRYLAVAVSCALILALASMQIYAHWLFARQEALPASPVYIAALLIVPVAAATSLAIGLLIAAFRGYKDADSAEAAKAATNAARSGGSLG